jgi:hypothetical protein
LKRGRGIRFRKVLRIEHNRKATITISLLISNFEGHDFRKKYVGWEF